MGTSPFFFRGNKMLNRGLDKLELLRIVEAVANEKSIDKELVIGSMESAIQKAALTKFGNDNNIEVIIISNTSDSTRDSLNNIQRHQKGGLSGKPIKEKSTKLIKKFYKILDGRVKIIGVGGIDSGKNAYEKFLAGANYLQLYTGMVFRGPNIVHMIKKELKELLNKDGVKNFVEIIGKK